MQKFKMPDRNSCSQCGRILEKGATVFAANRDQVRAGTGICTHCHSGDAPPPSGLLQEAPLAESLSSMTVDELRALADDQDIDLGSARLKAEIIDVLIEAEVELPAGED